MKAFLYYSIAFLSFFLSSTTIAVELKINFTPTLTNSTGWVYAPNTAFSAAKQELYITRKDSPAVLSPIFDFAVTSLIIRARHTTDHDNRKLLYVIPIFNNEISDDERVLRDITPDGTAESIVSCSWSKDLRVRSFAFLLQYGAYGNVYLLDVTIYGVPISPAPTNIEPTHVGGTRISVKWQNPPDTLGNMVYIYKPSWIDETFETLSSYEFDEYSNDDDSSDLIEDFSETYPDFANSLLIYKPAKSNGQIQISKYNVKGALVHKGFENLDSISLDITLRKYFNNTSEDNSEMTIGYEEAPGATNSFTTITLEKEFKREIINLHDFPKNTPIILNATGNKTNHRIIIDNLRFIKNYSPKREQLNLVQAPISTTKESATFLNLERNTDYIIKVTTFNDTGWESVPLELKIKTTLQNDKGLNIRIK